MLIWLVSGAGSAHFVRQKKSLLKSSSLGQLRKSPEKITLQKSSRVAERYNSGFSGFF